MNDILAKILANKRDEVTRDQKRVSLSQLKERASQARPARSFLDALRSGKPETRVIAECKQKSPSKGVMIKGVYDPVALARQYERAGAAALSILTDEVFFGGHLEHLAAVVKTAAIPVLRKDFIFDPYQIYEARAAGADSFLLLAGVLSTRELDELITLGRSLGMEPLVESHDERDLEEACASQALILGINNRDLKTFQVSLEHAKSHHDRAVRGRPERVAVCESGIKTRKDIEVMRGVGYKAFLIGEALVTQSDAERALRDLLA